MCDIKEEVGIHAPDEAGGGTAQRTVAVKELLPMAEALAGWRENRDSHVGFVGYGKTAAGNKVLIAVDQEYDPAVPQAVAQALREKGARVDILTLDMGDPDREFDLLDEVRVIMRREPWEKNPRRWEGFPFVEDFAARRGYDLLVHGKGGPIPKTGFRYEQIPWLRAEHLLHRSTVYPLDLHLLINQKSWAPIWEFARGGRARLTDPEGTDITWSYWEEYYDGSRYGFSSTPRNGHLFSHPVPPLIAKEDAAGVVAGTTSHFSRAFPRARVELEAGQVVKVAGGAAYGDAWRDLLEESRRTQYPCFPRPGLFYLWEAAIGTNPKIIRPSRIDRHSSGGFEWERRRSGVIHMGFGTLWRAPEEKWAGERGLLYGHLHIHLLFPTLVVTAKNGRKQAVIRNGRLTALDDPEVRKLAANYGDPNELLSEDWIPQIPGITAAGSYEEYAGDPGRWIYGKG
ncbi:MAG: hypothetical protein A3F90_11320 [Deltaproteobacteria bacterium RIFCSPLOWO2_12_FULL_60_19]|nr:MAG: hypothetical protein A3F90_11320 [Deltaproteobacteria bacterium RIFCSPLOWO2_12_FULL_60_19]